MLRSLQDLNGFACDATDGSIGRVEDFYFDDRTWQIRVLVVATGDWLAGRKVLVPTSAIDGVEWSEGRLTASITQKQVRNSLDIDTMEPVSRQHELQRYGYYGYPPDALKDKVRYFDALAGMHRSRGDDLDLRNFRGVLRYHIHASDGDIGHVEGMLVDDTTWTIRYLVVDTSDWWLGHEVLVAARWIDDVSWLDATMAVRMTREAVRRSPAWHPDAMPDRQHETALHAHYQRPGYWI